jgi:hypothetical protein
LPQSTRLKVTERNPSQRGVHDYRVLSGPVVDDRKCFFDVWRLVEYVVQARQRLVLREPLELVSEYAGLRPGLLFPLRTQSANITTKWNKPTRVDERLNIAQPRVRGTTSSASPRTVGFVLRPFAPQVLLEFVLPRMSSQLVLRLLWTGFTACLAIAQYACRLIGLRVCGLSLFLPLPWTSLCCSTSS